MESNEKRMLPERCIFRDEKVDGNWLVIDRFVKVDRMSKGENLEAAAGLCWKFEDWSGLILLYFLLGHL